MASPLQRAHSGTNGLNSAIRTTSLRGTKMLPLAPTLAADILEWVSGGIVRHCNIEYNEEAWGGGEKPLYVSPSAQQGACRDPGEVSCALSSSSASFSVLGTRYQLGDWFQKQVSIPCGAAYTHCRSRAFSRMLPVKPGYASNVRESYFSIKRN